MCVSVFVSVCMCVLYDASVPLRFQQHWHRSGFDSQFPARSHFALCILVKDLVEHSVEEADSGTVCSSQGWVNVSGTQTRRRTHAWVSMSRTRTHVCGFKSRGAERNQKPSPSALWEKGCPWTLAPRQIDRQTGEESERSLDFGQTN